MRGDRFASAARTRAVSCSTLYLQRVSAWSVTGSVVCVRDCSQNPISSFRGGVQNLQSAIVSTTNHCETFIGKAGVISVGISRADGCNVGGKFSNSCVLEVDLVPMQISVGAHLSSPSSRDKSAVLTGIRIETRLLLRCTGPRPWTATGAVVLVSRQAQEANGNVPAQNSHGVSPHI